MLLIMPINLIFLIYFLYQGITGSYGNLIQLVAVIMTVLICFFIYFLPTMIAYKMNNNNKLSVFLLNVFIGLTFFGWLVALIKAIRNIKV